jgi:glycosyltransferase involved in cell wall biosynthesis
MRQLSQLKICFLAGTLGQGGAERQLFYILQALCQAGATARLLSLDRGGIWEERIKTLGISVGCLGDNPSRLKRLLRVLKTLRSDVPDVVQSQHFFANAYAGLSARLLRIAGIGALRNDGRSEVEQCGHWGGWLNLQSPRILAANSQIAIRYVSERGIPPSRIYFLPNVVDTERFKPAIVELSEPLTLLAVGRLVKQKRLDRFIAVIGMLRNLHNLNVRGLIVGAGCPGEDLRPELEHEARQWGLLPNHIRFRGSVADIRPVYCESAVCVLTSDHEGTPNAMLEAMASGLPVVAANVGGVPGIVRDGHTGFLIEPDDLDGFVARLAELVKNAELRKQLGRRARTMVEENHSLQRLPAYLDGLYQFAIPEAAQGFKPASSAIKTLSR